MTAREYLGRIRTENIKIKQKMEQLEMLQQAAISTGIKLDADRVQTSPKEGTPEIIIKYLDLEAEIKIDVERREKIRDDVISMIHKLDDDKQVKVLYEKWVKGRKVEDIACDFPYSEKHTWRIYSEAMKEMEKIIKNE